MLAMRRFRHGAWVAVLAVLLNAFAPHLSHSAPSSGPGAGWVEVCSVDGARLVHADVPAPLLPDLLKLLGHCPHCLPQATAHGLLAPARISVPLVRGPDVVARAPSFAPQPAATRSAHHQRAPPRA